MSYKKDFQFLTMAQSIADTFSTCSKAQAGAVVVDDRYRVLGMGYNGSPPGMDHCMEGACPRLQANSAPGSDYSNCIANHAEANALLNTFDLHRATVLYVNTWPCFACAKLIAATPIELIYFIRDDTRTDTVGVDLLHEAGKVALSVSRDILESNMKDFYNARNENQLHGIV